MADSSNILENTFLSDCFKDGLPGLESALTNLSLKAPKELQEGIFQISSFATGQFLELIGIGSGFTSLDMQGFALAQINQKLDEIQKKMDTMLDTPAKAALTYLERGIESIKAKNNSLAFDEFKRVIDNSIIGRNYKKDDLKTVVDLTLYSLFADLMVNTYDSRKDLFVPYELLEPEKKMAIRNKMKQHLVTLLEVQNKNKPSKFSLPSTRREKKEANQNLVDSVLKRSLQYVCPPGAPVPVNFIPDGEEDTALVNLDGKPGRIDDSTVLIHKEGSNVVIHNFRDKKILVATIPIDCEHRQELVVTANQSGLTIDNKAAKVTSLDSTSLIDAAKPLSYTSLIDAVKSLDCTKLLDASRKGDSAVVSLLVQRPGVQLNQRDSSNLTPLHLAAWGGHLEVTRILLRAGADKSSVDNIYKATPLHWAAWNRHLQVVKALVQAGADTTAVNSDGQTPAQWAKDCDHNDVVNYLKNV